MSKIIFNETVSGFALNADYGYYCAETSPAAFSLTVGGSYKVAWDGVEYEVTGQDTSAIIADTVSIGNLVNFGLSGNNEPFVIVAAETYNSFFAAHPDNTDESHTIAVYDMDAEEEEETPAVEYTGSIDLISGLRPKNGGSFPLVYAPDVLLTDGRRLSDVDFDALGGAGGGSGALRVVFSSSDGQTSTCDKTFAEVKEAYNGGEFVYGELGIDGMAVLLPFLGFLSETVNDVVMEFAVFEATVGLFNATLRVLLTSYDTCEVQQEMTTEYPPATVDLSAFEIDGVIVETYSDGTSKTTTVEFDESGNPVKITDGDGYVTDLTW